MTEIYYAESVCDFMWVISVRRWAGGIVNIVGQLAVHFLQEDLDRP